MEVIKDVELHVGTPTMSINQMTEFVAASERGKRAIVRKQKHPSTYRIRSEIIRGCHYNSVKQNPYDPVQGKLVP